METRHNLPDDPPRIAIGAPHPLGATLNSKGINFALFTRQLEELTLAIFLPGHTRPLFEYPLDPKRHRTGNIWHISLSHLPKEGLYAYKIQGELVLDPYAKEISRRVLWKMDSQPDMGPELGMIFSNKPFDWEKDQPLHLPKEELIIYEMHVRGFTQDLSAHSSYPGTFLGMIEKIPYLKKLGINAVELLPLFTFDETDHPEPDLCNYWGYSTHSFFAPMRPYGSILEFKQLIKALHKSGIEVILDVVYNHVGGFSFEKIDKKSYFILGPNSEHTNYSGCGNTTQCNRPPMLNLIIDSLHYWVKEMHVDGFRFDLASIFCRGKEGEVLEDPPLIKALEESPILSKTKLIAEPWDCGGLYQVGTFPGKGRFAQWNGQFRDRVRRFIKGSDGAASLFASALCGSQDLFGHLSPDVSINFITAHDGFTLADLFSYNVKHNENNKEGNVDGSNHNESWNCGIEGFTEDQNVCALRKRQIKNSLFALFFSFGVPMLLMGDEYGHTRGGNNNAYCQDNATNYFLWDKKDESLFQFVQKLIALRKKFSLLQSGRFPTEEEIHWHGTEPHCPDWSGRFVAYTLISTQKAHYIAFNASFEGAHITLPSHPHQKKWKRIFDTAFDEGSIPLDDHYYLAPYSSLLLA